VFASGCDLDALAAVTAPGPGTDGPTMWESGTVTACAVCGQAAAGWGYDGLDPNEQRDPHTGRVWSAGMTRYRPVCTAH
jgi:hypothetical protein